MAVQKGKSWALITGASSGIGEATATVLASQGYDLLLLARRKDRLDKLSQGLSGLFPEQKFISAAVDVTDRKQVDQFCQNHKAELLKLQLLVNNAGLARGTDKFHEAKMQDIDEMLDVNVRSLLYLTRAILPYFVAKSSGHIVNLGSVAGRWTYPGGAVYAATKFAVRALSEGLRLDLQGKNIRVTNIEPGMVNTEFSLVRFRDQAKADQVYAGMKPLTAKDIAETIGWVVSRPEHINIQELVIYPTDQASVRDVYRNP